MAVSLQPCLPGQLCSTVEKAREISKTTLDHLRRILSDHDYLKHSAPDKENSEKMSRVLTEDEPHVGQKNDKNDTQDNCSSFTSHDSKVEKPKELPNDGIQASDLSSLLYKFEEAIGNSVNILTPATSPGHFEHLSEPLSLKINSHTNATDFTPPTTPPVQEQPEQKHVQNNRKPSIIQNHETIDLPLEKHNAVNKKGKSETEVSNKMKQKAGEIGSKVHAKDDIKLSEKEKKSCKRKFKDTVSGMISSGKKAKTDVASKNEPNMKSSENCQESKSVVPKTSCEDKGSTKKIVNEECIKNSGNEPGELLSSEIGSDASDLVEEKSKKLNEEEKIVVPSSNVLQKSLNAENNSSVNLDSNENVPEICVGKEDTIELQIKRVKESLNKMSSSDYDVNEETLQKLNSREEHNNNNKTDLKVDSCRIVNDNNLNEENTRNKDSHRNEDHKRKSKHFEKTSKRTDDYKDDRRKRRHRSKSASNDEDGSGEERLKPRKSEKHSRDSERGKEKYRKYSSRDDYDREYSSRDEYDRDYYSRSSQGRKYSNEERRNRNHDEDREKKPKKYIRDIEHERKIDFRLGRSSMRDVAKEERRVIYVGGLPYGTTRDELWKRFRKFGPIEKVTVHLRVGVRDNYGFVTFLEPEDARDCIERGNSDPTEPHYDLCFGGRRQFCGGSYVDFDSTTSHIEELSETYGKVCDEVPEEDDFDSLLRMCQEGLGR